MLPMKQRNERPRRKNSGSSLKQRSKDRILENKKERTKEQDATRRKTPTAKGVKSSKKI
jgi:hypothetical protein